MVFRCNRNKSPGLDGFTMAFYQDNWDCLKGMSRDFSRNSLKGVS